MTKSEFNNRIDALIDAEYEAIGGDKFREQVGDEMVRKLVLRGYGKRATAERARDPEFCEAWIASIADDDVNSYVSKRRPVGAYRKDGILVLGENMCVFMRDATRDHLLAWALCEDDEHNLAYIKSRLDAWDAHPECKTLAQLERDVFGWRPES